MLYAGEAHSAACRIIIVIVLFWGNAAMCWVISNRDVGTVCTPKSLCWRDIPVCLHPMEVNL